MRKKNVKDFIEALREIKKENKDFEITLSRKEVLELVNEFDKLNNIINALKQNELYCVDYETEEDIEKGNKIYIPFDLEEFIKELKILDKENKDV